MPNTFLNLTQLGMRFPTPKGEFVALKKVDLRIQEGEFISLIGHSGCGKSTVLNLVAGLHDPTDGGVILQGREVDGPGPERAVVFQNHSLLPWLSVYQNVELAVKQLATKNLAAKNLATTHTGIKKNKSWVRDQVQHYLELVQMTHASDKKPDEISGGMKQRVGIARALALQPKVLLMDEPFGALDALTRAHLQDALMAIHAELDTTVIMITHDVDEAVLLSDRIVMMTNGPAATIGEVLDVNLDRPRNRVQLADNVQYQKYRQSVLRFLYEKQAKPPQTVLATQKQEEPLEAPKSA
ncbi:ABC transporter ATP-binding protein [Vibrio penaeicida]|uniref:Nitrate ABC transporter ATP-binding protein n=1 Tax=Vibrio penaeicida TaxID=104609 RepID=A0AAV5P0H4_9VIBR|nr:ABC transporter ATP-binding protein [Vibrio penaeicida]GLQ76098.1 nitrate ABC transporter ATP-binding protein [Vibrio penaeicida]